MARAQRGNSGGWWLAVAALVGMVGGTEAARAAVVHLDSGAALLGDVTEVHTSYLMLRGPLGIVRVPRGLVMNVEHPVAAYDRYTRRRDATPATADELVALAAWCQQRGLLLEREQHLWEAVRLVPDHAEARAGLGHVRVGRLWVDGRATPGGPDEAAEQRRLAATIQAQWERDIRAIVTEHFATRNAERLQQGRDKLKAITDPLAVAPLFRALTSSRRVEARLALLDALATFTGEEATDYLVVASLEDAETEVRERALQLLAARADPHAVTVLRAALRENDTIMRRAAYALGMLGARAAIPDLIASLTDERSRNVEQPGVPMLYLPVLRRNTVLFGWSPVVTWYDQSGLPLSGPPLWDRMPNAYTWYWWGQSTRPEYRRERVTVYYTEVRAALVRLTGQDFGFDRAQWEQWYAAQGAMTP